MNTKLLLNVALGIAVLGLTGCDQLDGLDPGLAASARIMQQDQSQMALLLNKGFSTSVVAINDGKSIEPCKIDQQAGEKERMTAVTSCYPDGHNPDGKILFEDTYTVTVREGSTCITVRSGAHVYVFCQPPFSLGF